MSPTSPPLYPHISLGAFDYMFSNSITAITTKIYIREMHNFILILHFILTKPCKWTINSHWWESPWFNNHLAPSVCQQQWRQYKPRLQTAPAVGAKVGTTTYQGCDLSKWPTSCDLPLHGVFPFYPPYGSVSRPSLCLCLLICKIGILRTTSGYCED